MPDSVLLTRRTSLLLMGGAAALALPGTALARPQVGTPAPTFSGVGSDGKSYKLADYRGRTVVLEWTNHECPYVGKHYRSGNMQALQRDAAAKGFVAEERILEMPKGFFAAYGGAHLEDVTRDLGKEWDIVTNMAIKLVPGGHPHHAAAEAAANAAIAANAAAADIATIEISAPKYKVLPGPAHPTDLIGVAHSPAYIVAAAVADRGYGWIHAKPEKVTDPVIAGLIDKIRTDPDPAPYPDRFPHHHGATVTITLQDGRRFSSHVDFPRGSGPQGIDWADVDAKYRALLPLSGLAPAAIERGLEVVHRFEQVAAVSELTSLLAA